MPKIKENIAEISDRTSVQTSEQDMDGSPITFKLRSKKNKNSESNDTKQDSLDG